MYIDGSATDPCEPEFTRLGYGLAMVDENGSLLAVAHVVPPPWITDSAGAEAWALYVSLTFAPVAPNIVTDCLGLLRRLQDGTCRATAEAQPHARIWGMILNILDSDKQVIACAEKLFWMPSHIARCDIGQSTKSDGTAVSALDWRANRLADAAAKQSAMANRPPSQVRERLKFLQQAYSDGIVALATVTHAANYHQVTTLDETGAIATI